MVDSGQEKIRELQANNIIPPDVKVNTTTDLSEQIRADLNSLTRDFAITLVLVCGTLFLFIGLKEAFVPTLTIPLVFLLTFVVLRLAGQTLNFLSLFSLVLSLGLLVDDAILIVTGFDQYYKSNKFTARQAMLLTLRDLKWADISTTLTTVWIFAAMLFMTGIIGKFIFSIPFVIMTTLLLSLVLSLTIVPALTLFFHGDTAHKHRKDEKETFWTRRFVSFEPLIVRYEKALKYLIATRARLWKFLGAVVGLFFLSVSFPIIGLLRTEFFPADNQDIVFINLVAEPGQRLEVTDEQIQKVETMLQKEDPEIVNSFTTTVGGAAATGELSSGSGSSTNLASITINLKKKDDGRTETSQAFADRLRTNLKQIQIP